MNYKNFAMPAVYHVMLSQQAKS